MIRLKRPYEPADKNEGPVTFVYAAKDEKRNSALVLKEFMEGRV